MTSASRQKKAKEMHERIAMLEADKRGYLAACRDMGAEIKRLEAVVKAAIEIRDWPEVRKWPEGQRLRAALAALSREGGGTP